MSFRRRNIQSFQFIAILRFSFLLIGVLLLLPAVVTFVSSVAFVARGDYYEAGVAVSIAFGFLVWAAIFGSASEVLAVLLSIRECAESARDVLLDIEAEAQRHHKAIESKIRTARPVGSAN